MASEEKTEFRFDPHSCGADANLVATVDRLSWWCGTGFLMCVLDERLQVLTSVYKCLRVFASVFVLSWCDSCSLCDGLQSGSCRCRLSRMSVGREFMRVYERLQAFSCCLGAIHAVYVMGAVRVLPVQVVSYERWTRVYERLRAFSCCLNCSSCDLCDGLQLGLRRRWRARSTVCVRCTRVVRTLTWWDEMVGSCRVMSGYVG